MSQISCCFILTLPDTSEINHECIIPCLPQKNDFIWVTGIEGKPYTSLRAKCKRVGLMLDVEVKNYQYAILLEMIEIFPIDISYEIVRKM